MRNVQIFVLGILFVLAVFLLPVEAKSDSHLGQKIQDHVMLVADFVPEEQAPCPGLFAQKDLFRVFPDGTQSSDPFRVPNGKILVITDVAWSVFDEDNLFDAGSMVLVGITIGNQGPVVFESSVFVPEGAGAPQTVRKNESLTAGFPVGENGVVCAFAYLHINSLVTSQSVGSLYLRGYLINAPE
jgi:hypothetical protein